MYYELLRAFLLSLIGTIVLSIIFRTLGERKLIGNLYSLVRGGTPRALGLVPFITLSLFLPNGFNDLILAIGVFTFADDLLGRRKIGNLSVEWGQLMRGIGMLVVIGIGFPLMGYSAILVAFLVQPLNISDMQPGSTCSVVISLSLFTTLTMILLRTPNILEIPVYYTPLIILVVCLGYAPLDYSGKIMMGEIGNHSFAVALGISFFMLGGFWWTLCLFFMTTTLIAIIRRGTLKVFFVTKLNLHNPTFGDYFMDILTGGGLGDFLRGVLLGKKQIAVKNPIFILLGFRRLLYNPFADNIHVGMNKHKPIVSLEKK
jgi:hypothetical protein